MKTVRNCGRKSNLNRKIEGTSRRERRELCGRWERERVQVYRDGGRREGERSEGCRRATTRVNVRTNAPRIGFGMVSMETNSLGPGKSSPPPPPPPSPILPPLTQLSSRKIVPLLNVKKLKTMDLFIICGNSRAKSPPTGNSIKK